MVDGGTGESASDEPADEAASSNGPTDQEALRDRLEAAGLAVSPPTETAAVDGTGPDEGTRSSTGEENVVRGQSLYDWWSDHPQLYAAVIGLAEPLFDSAFDALDATHGEVVCDLGCGNGRNFPRLSEAVADEGVVVGVDYSEGMVARARERVRADGLTNVQVARGDATETIGPPETYDAVFTTFALHTMTDAHAVLENVRDALAPGGRFVALDGGGLRAPGTRWLNPLFERVLAYTVDHQIGQDTLAATRDVFDDVTVVETFDAGSGYVLHARKRPETEANA